MFVRKKKNKSGVVSIQIIDKSSGLYRVHKTVGSSRNLDEIVRLVQKAHISLHPSDIEQSVLFPSLLSDDTAVENFLNGVMDAHIHARGHECIFGELFNRIGFDVIPNELFRHLVLARITYPVSKLKTVDYLYHSQGVVTNEDAIYRFLDTLNEKYKTTIERIAFSHKKKVLGNISVVFYDMLRRISVLPSLHTLYGKN